MPSWSPKRQRRLFLSRNSPTTKKCRLAAEGKKPDAALERRIRARSELVRQQILRTHGVVEIGADIIRDMRDAVAALP
jgi:hypothetical protein